MTRRTLFLPLLPKPRGLLMMTEEERLQRRERPWLQGRLRGLMTIYLARQRFEAWMRAYGFYVPWRTQDDEQQT